MIDQAAQDFTTEVDANIARNLKQARERAGLSQAELAQRVTDVGVPGFHQTTIARIEAKQRPLRAAEAIALCRVLEITLEWLAESDESALMRAEISHLRQKVADFDMAASELLHARRLAAIGQDAKYPYDADGEADMDVVVRSGIDPSLYERLEDQLVASSLDAHLEVMYINELARDMYSRPDGQGHKSRLEFLGEEIADWIAMRERHRGALVWEPADGVDQAAT